MLKKTREKSGKPTSLTHVINHKMELILEQDGILKSLVYKQKSALPNQDTLPGQLLIVFTVWKIVKQHQL